MSFVLSAADLAKLIAACKEFEAGEQQLGRALTELVEQGRKPFD